MERIDEHYRKLAHCYTAARVNAFYAPSLEVTDGAAEVRFEITPAMHHAAGAAHGSVYFKALDDAAFFAANSQDSNNGEASSGTFIGLGTMSSAADVDYISPGSPNFDYHLLPTSPAIDEASGSSEPFDVDGESRTDPDIGADEQNEPVVGDAIFADGFESGNTNAWSQTVG